MRSTIVLATLVLAGCAATQTPPIAVIGPDVLPLAGEWRGSYELPRLNRGGSIMFMLASGEDHAHGDVVMTPAGSNQPLRPAPECGPVDPDYHAPAQALAIRLVRVRGDTVSGTLAPYEDPECRCTAVASFRGVVHGDFIRGVFEVRRAAETLSGTWSVRRHI